MRLADIAIYPTKSARGIAVPSADMESRGLRGDRRWMFVDDNGRFVSQRELPALARLSVRLRGEGHALLLDGDAIEIARPTPDAARMPVRVWRDTLLLPRRLRPGTGSRGSSGGRCGSPFSRTTRPGPWRTGRNRATT